VRRALCPEEGALDQIFAGDEVVVTVTGANTAEPEVIDNEDGTYTAQYTPTVSGPDAVDIRILNLETGILESISGSPFTSEVTPPAPDLVVSQRRRTPSGVRRRIARHSTRSRRPVWARRVSPRATCRGY